MRCLSLALPLLILVPSVPAQFPKLRNLIKFTPEYWVGKLARSAARPLGVDPDQVETAFNPMGRLVEHAPEILSSMARAELERVTSEIRLVQGLLTGNIDRLESAAVRWAGAQWDLAFNPGVAAAMQPLLSPVVPWFLRETFMDFPTVIPVNPEDYSGTPVFYVNGIDTPLRDARDEAAALSRQVERPVALIYNPTGGIGRDLLEAFYDREWHSHMMPLRHFVQANSVTRQVTFLLYHATEPISIASHSQGCLIVRNALVTADAFSGGKVRHNVSWVATGLPMKNSELHPAVNPRVIADRRDPVSQVIGVRWDMKRFSSLDLASHSFVRNYVSKISSNDFWASDAPAPSTWRAEANIESVQIRYDLNVPSPRGGFAQGLRVSTNLTVDNVRGRDCMAVAYFSWRSGQPLLDFDGALRSVDNQVAAGIEFCPGFDSTRYDRLSVDIPYAQLHLGNGSHALMLQVKVYVKRTLEFIGESSPVPFGLDLETYVPTRNPPRLPARSSPASSPREHEPGMGR